MQHVPSLLVALSHTSAAGDFTEWRLSCRSQGPALSPPVGLGREAILPVPRRSSPSPSLLQTSVFGSPEAVARPPEKLGEILCETRCAKSEHHGTCLARQLGPVSPHRPSVTAEAQCMDSRPRHKMSVWRGVRWELASPWGSRPRRIALH